MKVYVDCPHCGKCIGEMDLSAEDYPQHLGGLLVKELQDMVLNCSHPEPAKTVTPRLFGLIEETLVVYPETDTTSFSDKYIGPSNKFCLWLALLFCGGDSISVNGEPAWWDFKTGFFGPGVNELANLKPKSV